MKKFKEFFKKYACNASAILLTGVLAGVATRGCYFVYYQPECEFPYKSRVMAT